MTTCKDHMIYNHMIYATQGHVTFEPGEPTGGMARQARISSQVSQQEGWLDELTFRARRANRKDGLMSSHFEPGEPTGVMARRAQNTTHYISSEDFPYGIFVFNSCCDPDY